MILGIREKKDERRWYSATVDGNPQFVKARSVRYAAKFDEDLAGQVLRQLIDITGKDLELADPYRS